MSRSIARTLLVLVLFTTLAIPSHAQNGQSRNQKRHFIADSISWLWGRISTPMVQLLGGTAGSDTAGVTPPPPTTDGRGALDPNG